MSFNQIENLIKELDEKDNEIQKLRKRIEELRTYNKITLNADTLRMEEKCFNQIEEINLPLKTNQKNLEFAISHSFHTPNLKKLSGFIQFDVLKAFCMKCPQLEEINNELKCDFLSIGWIGKCKNLQRLTLSGVLIFNDSDFDNFTSGCQNLKYLCLNFVSSKYIQKSSRMTPSIILSIIRGMPNLEYLIVPDSPKGYTHSVYPNLKLVH